MEPLIDQPAMLLLLLLLPHLLFSDVAFLHEVCIILTGRFSISVEAHHGMLLSIKTCFFCDHSHGGRVDSSGPIYHEI